jgi:hypothetical protein
MSDRSSSVMTGREAAFWGAKRYAEGMLFGRVFQTTDLRLGAYRVDFRVVCRHPVRAARQTFDLQVFGKQ